MAQLEHAGAGSEHEDVLAELRVTVVDEYVAAVPTWVDEHERARDRLSRLLHRARTEGATTELRDACDVWSDCWFDIEAALATDDERTLKAAYWAGVLSFLVPLHRRAWEEALIEPFAQAVVGHGFTSLEGAGLDTDALAELDGLCMAALRGHIDAGSWQALYRWAWTHYGPTYPATLPMRRVAARDQ